MPYKDVCRYLTFSFTGLIMLVGGVSVSYAFDQARENRSTPENTFLTHVQIESDLALIQKAYRTLHPGYTRYTSQQQFDKAWAEIKQRSDSQGGMTQNQFYLAIQKVLVMIRCDHTKANLPKNVADYRDTKPVYLPFRWDWIEQRAFVKVPDQDNKLSIFDEILAIDGRSIIDVVNEVIDYIPFDGVTEWSRLSGVSESLEFKGGAVDHFGALLRDVKPTTRLTVKRADSGKVEMLEMDRIDHEQWRELGDEKVRNFRDAITFERIGADTAYLRIDTFVNYRTPVKPDSLYRPIFEALRKEGRNKLIVDLRKNGGGSSDASFGLMSYLIDKKLQFKTDMRVNTLAFDDLTEHLWTWDKRAINPNRLGFSKNDDGSYSLRSWVTDELDTIKPQKFAFKGKIVALTSHSNSSGSTNLLSVLKSEGRITTIGEKTGGSAEGVTAGVLFTLTLPESNITTRIPFFRYTNNVNDFELGMGLKPDVEAPMTADAYLAKQDPALGAALAYFEM